MTLALLSLAHAVPVTFCVDYAPDFDDSDVPGASEDYFATNSPKPAQGVLVQAHAPGSGTTHSVFANIYSAEGCASFHLTTTEPWTVRVVSRMDVFGRTVDVRTSGGARGWWVRQVVSGWTPTAGTVQVNLPSARHWNVLAAAGQAMLLNQAGLADLDVDFFTEHTDGTLYLPPACSSDPCVDGTDIYVDDTTARRKFQIAYLQGWAALHAMGWSDSDYDDSADDQHCGNGSSAVLTLETLEHAPAGFLEGYAHWYAASAFNNAGESDCTYVYWRPVNWDRLDRCFADREAAGGHVLSCATGPNLPPYEGLVPPTDYRGYCKERAPGSDPGSPTPFPASTVVPLDVVRFLRDRVLNDSGLTTNDIGAAFDALRAALPVEPLWRQGLKTQAVGLGADATDWDDAMQLHGLDQ